MNKKKMSAMLAALTAVFSFGAPSMSADSGSVVNPKPNSIKDVKVERVEVPAQAPQVTVYIDDAHKKQDVPQIYAPESNSKGNVPAKDESFWDRTKGAFDSAQTWYGNKMNLLGKKIVGGSRWGLSSEDKKTGVTSTISFLSGTALTALIFTIAILVSRSSRNNPGGN